MTDHGGLSTRLRTLDRGSEADGRAGPSIPSTRSLPLSSDPFPRNHKSFPLMSLSSAAEPVTLLGHQSSSLRTVYVGYAEVPTWPRDQGALRPALPPRCPPTPATCLGTTTNPPSAVSSSVKTCPSMTSSKRWRTAASTLRKCQLGMAYLAFVADHGAARTSSNFNCASGGFTRTSPRPYGSMSSTASRNGRRKAKRAR